MLADLTNEHLGWIYGTPPAPIPAFSREQLNRVVDMHTLEQQLDVWKATVAYVQQHGALPAIERIIPALVSLWNASNGGCDVSSAYLKLLNNPSIKHMEIENILWDVTVRLGLLQAYHVWRWFAAGLKRINEATSFAQLTRICVRNEKTCKGFLSLAMKFFITHAIHPEPQQQQARPRPLCEPDVVVRQFVAYLVWMCITLLVQQPVPLQNAICAIILDRINVNVLHV